MAEGEAATGARKGGRRNNKRWSNKRREEDNARHEDRGQKEGRSEDSTIHPNDKAKGTRGAGKEKGGTYETEETAEGEGERGDVPGYVPTPEDLRLREVYGDWVHGNPGTHLDVGVKEDGLWKGWWRDLAVMPPC